MLQCRNLLALSRRSASKSFRVQSVSSNAEIIEKLVYSSVPDLIKNRDIEKTRSRWLTRDSQKLPDPKVVQKIRNESHFKRKSDEPIVPVALQFLYKGATEVQGPDVKTSVDPGLTQPTSSSQIDVFPFALYNPVDFENSAAKEPDFSVGSNKILRSAGRRAGRRGRSAASEAVGFDKIDRNEEFEVITDNLEPDAAKKLLSQDDMFKYGSSDPDIPTSKVPCGKCGAHLHCQDPKLPGFLPVEIFRDKTDNQLRHLQCQRCYILSEYNIALKMNVAPEDYPKTIAHLRETPAVIVLIVDLLDFPGSVWPNIMELLGKNKKVILVGNKVDLLPQDSSNYLRRIETSMEKTFLKKCSQSGLGFSPKILATLLVSARTGYGIESLINKIFTYWKDNEARVGGDVYLIGTTNVGKSSIFNLLLESDLCSIKAIDKVEKALTSPVPGTTLNLLKFPIMRPDPSRLAQRFDRLRRERTVQTEREKVRIEMLRKFKDRRFCAVQGQPIGQTFVQQLDKNIPLRGGGFTIDVNKPIRKNIPARLNPEHRDFANGEWCYDSPGTVSEDQIINLLTQEEVMKTLPQLPLLPRSFDVRVGLTVFIAGLARFDVLDGPMMPNGYKNSLNLTVFTSDDLPINIVATADADNFYEAALGTDILAVPSGSPERLQSFPRLQGVEFDVDSRTSRESSCDVVLSSAGWISCTPRVAEIFRIKAWTPGGKGIFLREPPFLPHAIELRGDKVRGTPAFRNNKFFIPNRN